MKIVVIFDQGLSGLGGKSNLDLPLTIQKGSVGTGLILSQHLNKVNAEIIATLSCGVNTFNNDKENTVLKLCAMVKKINPDFVLVGPCFDFKDYALMSAMTCKLLKEKSIAKAVSMMSIENKAVIDEYAKEIDIIKMPKKGGTGLNDSLADLCEYIEALNNQDKLDELKKRICY